MMCDSCGADVAHVDEVHRKYVTAAEWDQQPTERLLPDVEQWCFACRTHYPHDSVIPTIPSERRHRAHPKP